MKRIILAINPGSTSTKLALYKEHEVVLVKNYPHEKSQLSVYTKMADQLSFRMGFVDQFLEETKIKPTELDLIVGRGGLLKPLKSGGTYLVNEAMIEDLANETYGTHASNLGALMASEVANRLGKPSYIVDPVIVDEMDDIAKVTGLKGITKISIFHALNQKAVAKRYASDFKKDYKDLSVIVAHLGGGISVGWHHFGRVVDVNNALGGEGPFTPERSGTLPALQLLTYCLKHSYTYDQMSEMLTRKGGLLSYLDTNDGFEIRRRIEDGDQEAKFYLEAMAYQIAKEIGSLYFASKGKVQSVLLTGGLAHFGMLVDLIKAHVEPILPVVLYPGENEMAALVQGVLRIADGVEEVHTYQSKTI